MPLFLLLAFSFSKEIEQNLMKGIILPVALVPQKGTLAAPGKIVSGRLWAALMWNAFESIKSDLVYIVHGNVILAQMSQGITLPLNSDVLITPFRITSCTLLLLPAVLMLR